MTGHLEELTGHLLFWCSVVSNLSKRFYGAEWPEKQIPPIALFTGVESLVENICRARTMHYRTNCPHKATQWIHNDKEILEQNFNLITCTKYISLSPSLFDLVPGLESFELKYYRGSTESRGFAYAAYRTIELACYAKRKLDGLEYPPGHKLIVKYAEERPAGNRDRQVRYNQLCELLLDRDIFGSYRAGGTYFHT